MAHLFNSECPSLTESEWLGAAQFEALLTVHTVCRSVVPCYCFALLSLNIFSCPFSRGPTHHPPCLQVTEKTIKLVQTEKHMVGALGYLLRKKTLTLIRSRSYLVIILSEVTADPNLPREIVLVDDFEPVAATAHSRLLLACQRRWCGNTTETLDSNWNVIIMEREKLASCMDIRTLNAVQYGWISMLQELYIKFSMRKLKFEKQRDEASQPVVDLAGCESEEEANGVEMGSGKESAT